MAIELGAGLRAIRAAHVPEKDRAAGNAMRRVNAGGKEVVHSPYTDSLYHGLQDRIGTLEKQGKTGSAEYRRVQGALADIQAKTANGEKVGITTKMKAAIKTDQNTLLAVAGTAAAGLFLYEMMPKSNQPRQ